MMVSLEISPELFNNIVQIAMECMRLAVTSMVVPMLAAVVALMNLIDGFMDALTGLKEAFDNAVAAVDDLQQYVAKLEAKWLLRKGEHEECKAQKEEACYKGYGGWCTSEKIYEKWDTYTKWTPNNCKGTRNSMRWRCGELKIE